MFSHKLRRGNFLISLFLLASASPLAASSLGDLVVLVTTKNNPSVRPKGAIEVTVLKKIFLGREQSWKDSKVRPGYFFPKSEMEEFFFSEVMGTTPSEFGQYWRRKLFSGKGFPPRRFDRLKEALEFVEERKGAMIVLNAVVLKGRKLDPSVVHLVIK